MVIFSKEQVLDQFISRVKILLPRIYFNCVLNKDEFKKKIYGKLILSYLRNYCSARADMLHIYSWLGIHPVTISSTDYCGMLFDEFFPAYSEKDGGLTILNKIIDDLEDLETENQNS